MQHPRIFNSQSNPRSKNQPSTNLTNTQQGSPSILAQQMSANQASLTIGSSASIISGTGSTTISSPSNFMNRNIGSTITIGRKDNSNQHDIHRTPNLSMRTIAQNRDPIQLTVWFHELRSSEEDVIIDSNALPGGVRNGQLYELQSLESESSKKLLFIINNRNLRDRPEEKPVNLKSKLQISLISSLQRLMDLPPRSLVQIKQILDPKLAEVDSVEIFIKDVNLSRDSMWNFSSTLVNTCTYVDKRLIFLQNRCGTVKAIYKRGKRIFSGYITESTKIIFRSESAKLTLLVQLSREMWDFEENGEIIFHKLVNNLFPKIFKRWRDKQTHHSITIVLFTSVDLTDIPWMTLNQGERPNNRRDYYRVVVDQVNLTQWDKIMANLRLEFANFKRDIMLEQSDNSGYILEGEPLPSVKGNLLEAINLATSMSCSRFVNTDLKHSLNHLMVVTPGTGLFDVDYQLLVETSKKLSSIDSGLDIICLSQPPLHIVPLFRYNKNGAIGHCVPTWCDISFFKDSNRISNQWMPRCKIYELQMMGVMENNRNDVRIERFQTSTTASKTLLEIMDDYDNNAFQKINRQRLLDSDNLSNFEIKNKSKIDKVKKPRITPLKNAQATLSLIFNARTTLLPTTQASSSTISSALGTVTHTSNETSALSKLYTINKNVDDRTIAPPSRSITPISATIRSFDSFGGSKESKARPIMIEKDSHRHSTTSSIKNKHHKQPKRRSQSKGSNGNLSSSQELEKATDLFWTEISNPSKDLNAETIIHAKVSRWSNVFPTQVKRKIIKWKSFGSPAALPITTLLFPTANQLETEYTFQIYSVMLNDENYLELRTTHELMREMIQLRLLLGFQICFGDVVKKVEAERKTGGSAESLIKYFPAHGDSLGARIYMSLENEIHRIHCDYNGNLNVQLYRRTENTEENNKIHLGPNRVTPYFPLIRTRYVDEYSNARMDCINSKPQTYNWNQFDQFLAGFEDAMPESNKEFFKMKFVIMPAPISKNSFFISNESLSDEEIRVEGLRKLIALIEKGRYIKREDQIKKKKQQEPIPEVVFYTGNLYDFLNEEAENHDITGNQPPLMIPENMRFNKSIKLSDLAQELQSPTGLKLVDRTWHFKQHLHCFLGTEIVSWLLECFEDIDTREEATAYGQSLMNKKLFKHVESRHGLLDGYYFYEFEDEFIDKTYKESQTAGSGWFAKKVIPTPAAVPERNNSGSNTPIPGTPTYTRNNSDAESTSSPNVPENLDLRVVTSSNLVANESSEVSSMSGSLTHGKKRKKFILSKSIKFNVDPLNKSYRPEIITVHYDRVHNPEHCYHIRLQWLNASSKFIDETITTWSRLCDRHGLKLVETPWKELCTIPQINPFHSFVEMKFVINPWLDDEFIDPRIIKINKFYYHFYFLKKCEFLLDNRASLFFQRENIDISYSWGKPTFQYAQYIHKTGSYIVELRDNGDFFVAPNNIHVIRNNTNLSNLPDNDKSNNLDSQTIMLNFRSACQDVEFLKSLFREAKEVWREEFSAEVLPADLNEI
ncbi:vacuolar membrane-associated protein IML1 [Scheffersomyces coipomensis]|uniref:vacuolar membrane-associated protein IML1 n=1 Tax=Scheffersomyces coipomensis TaxID=1788519 RepID=UPI00315C85DE